MRIITSPAVYLVGRQQIDPDGIDRFLKDHEVSWETDTEIGAEALCEMSGRVCYMSFGKGRKTNAEYLTNLISMHHGSVLEHAVWNFVITGVSRSFTHELVRHRAGFGYSQLSQRYVDESDTAFVEPRCIGEDAELHTVWREAVRDAQAAYCKLVEGLMHKFRDVASKTMRRKLARQAARSVLPNATETRIFVTGNARAWRHFVEARANEFAETEIRTVAVELLRILQTESPSLFGDYELEPLHDGTFAARTSHRKV